MKRSLALALIAAASGFAALAPATPAFAQGLSIPPRQDAQSPTGVSYGIGSFTARAQDLAIGGAREFDRPDRPPDFLPKLRLCAYSQGTGIRPRSGGRGST
jgi:hypothetical protein